MKDSEINGEAGAGQRTPFYKKMGFPGVIDSG
jgi:hypothetical protein